MKSRLNIAGVDLGFDRILPVSTNYSVQDIRDPGKIRGQNTKTIKIPGSAEANKVFEYTFDTTIQSSAFNANLGIDAIYYVNEVEVFKGELQLLQAIKWFDGTTWRVEYECSLHGDHGGIFLAISQLFLTDIDFSDLDHPFTYASGLFNPVLGTGYCYGYADYGLSPYGDRVSETVTFEHLKPAIFRNEYVRRIFEDAGFSITTGGFFDSNYAKRIVIPCVKEGALQMSEATKADNQFLASIATTAGTPLTFNTYAGGGINIYNDRSLDPVDFDNDSTGLNYDPGNVYDTTAFEFTSGIDSTYILSSSITLTIDWPLLAGTVNGTYSVGGYIYKSTDSGATWSIAGQSVMSLSISSLAPANQTVNLFVSTPPTHAATGDLFKVAFDISNMVVVYVDPFAAPVDGTGTTITFDYAGNFGAVIASANLPSGQTVVMNDTIPEEVKQLDFLTSIIKTDNLYIAIDKDNPGSYIIEAREDFIDTDPANALDWTKKQDLKKQIDVQPMGELDAKRYLWTYAQDEDFYNKKYFDEFKEVYGTQVIDINTDFVTGEKKFELCFAATPIASAADVTTSGGLVDLVMPRFFKVTLDGVEPMKCKIRQLYWGGLISCSSHKLVTSGYPITTGGSGYTNPAAVIPKTEYPFMGHVDHPYQPTIDLNFGIAKRIYWVFPSQTFTDNTRYNERYSKFIQEISHRDSKLVTMYLNLNESDIREFNFRQQVFINDTYYFVNEIKDYDPQEQKSIPVELLKLNVGSVFVATHSQNYNDLFGGSMGSARTGPAFSSANNYGSGKSFGTNNTNNSVYTLVIGNGNRVG